ncbi:ATP-binding protein [Paenibacillus sp. strain BS8-2]
MSTTLFITIMTLLLVPVGRLFDLANVALLYLLPVLFNAVYLGLRPAIYASFLGVFAFDVFFVPPVLSLTVADLKYFITFGVYLVVAALTAGLATRLKLQAQYAKSKEAQTAALYAFSREMISVSNIHDLSERLLSQLPRKFGLQATMYVEEETGTLGLSGHTRGIDDNHKRELASIGIDYMYKRAEGDGSECLMLGQHLVYLAWLHADHRKYGLLVCYSESATAQATQASDEIQQVIRTLAGITANTIARIKLAEEAKIALVSAESERMRTTILNSVSHELRTPLAAVIGSATSLLENDHLFTPSDRVELLETIRDGSLRMNRLVNNLLNMVKLESGMLYFRKSWCDLEDVINAAVGQARDYQQQRKIRVVLHHEEPVVVPGDEVLLEQALVNIVSNAIKYSPDYSEIVITMTASAGQAVMTISDEGIGIKEAESELIFEKFYRADATKHITGTGLGLAICKGIIELHEGTIAVRANEQRGTVFTVSLPMV